MFLDVTSCAVKAASVCWPFPHRTAALRIICSAGRGPWQRAPTPKCSTSAAGTAKI